MDGRVFNLRSQGNMLHSRVSWSFESQNKPPLLGAGFVQVLDLVVVPLSQGALQEVQFDQSVQLPFTTIYNRYWVDNYRFYLINFALLFYYAVLIFWLNDSGRSLKITIKKMLGIVLHSWVNYLKVLRIKFAWKL